MEYRTMTEAAIVVYIITVIIWLMALIGYYRAGELNKGRIFICLVACIPVVGTAILLIGLIEIIKDLNK